MTLMWIKGDPIYQRCSGMRGDNKVCVDLRPTRQSTCLSSFCYIFSGTMSQETSLCFLLVCIHIQPPEKLTKIAKKISISKKLRKKCPGSVISLDFSLYDKLG